LPGVFISELLLIRLSAFRLFADCPLLCFRLGSWLWRWLLLLDAGDYL
jgi:hypothetical protein